MLKFVVLLNAISCIVFGSIFVLWSEATSQLLGDPPRVLLQVLGWGLLANAGLLVATAVQSQPSRGSIKIFVAGDAAWIVGTVALLVLGIWITTYAGVAWSVCVAAFVGLCGWLQWRYAPG